MNGFDFLNIIEILCIRFSKLRNITYIPMITFIRNIQNIQDPKTGKYVTNQAMSNNLRYKPPQRAKWQAVGLTPVSLVLAKFYLGQILIFQAGIY